ncbi:MAG: hypothetical protein OEY45_01560, partial [Gammaproteobacteria bacterium]|nr:hypothetical protein [Gammaproteobacteria bacterium]
MSLFLWLISFDNDQMPPYAILGAYTHRWFVLNVAVSYIAIWLLIILLFSPNKKSFLNILVSHIALVFLFIVLEFPAMLGLINYQKYLPSGMTWTHKDEKLWVKPGINTKGEAPTDLRIVYGIDAPMLPYSFQTDRFGLRNPVDKDNAGVLLLGDSILVAGLVPVEDTVSERLEKALNTRVMNISQIGYSPQESLGRLEDTGLSLDGRLVVHFIFEGNDLLDHKRWRNTFYGEVEKPWIPTVNRESVKVPWPDSGLVKTLLNMLLMHKKVLPEKRSAICRTAEETSEKVYFFYDAEMIRENMSEFPQLVSLLEKASVNVKSRGGKYAVVYIPTKISVLHEHCSFETDSHYADPSTRESLLGDQLSKACNRLG